MLVTACPVDAIHAFQVRTLRSLGFRTRVALANKSHLRPEFRTDYRVDVSVRQKLPVDGLQVFLDVNNTNNRQNIARQISIGGFTSQKNYGLTANIGVRYAFSLAD